MKDSLIEMAIEALEDEVFSQAIYRELARIVDDEEARESLRKLSEMEAKHAEFWREFLARRGVSADVGIPKKRVRFYALLARIIGAYLVLRFLESGEREAQEHYSLMMGSEDLDEDERAKLREILEDEFFHEEELASISSRFKQLLEHTRAAVLGMNDGLVEILSVSAGLAAAYSDPLHVALGGLIVGIGGALSMALGEFASVRAHVQVRRRTITRLELASRYALELLSRRLAEVFKSRGVPSDLAESLGDNMRRDPSSLSRLLAIEEYGVNPESLEDPLRSGMVTGSFYLLGAIIPLLPYLAGLPIGLALPLSFALAMLAVMASGFLIAISADLDPKRKILEMVILVLGAATITFGIGKIASNVLGIREV